MGPRGHSEISALLIPFACGASREGTDDTVGISYQKDEIRSGSSCLTAVEVKVDEKRGKPRIFP